MRTARVLEFLSARRRFIIIVALLAVVVVAAVATLGGGLVSKASESDLVVVEQVKVPDWRGPFLRFNRDIIPGDISFSRYSLVVSSRTPSPVQPGFSSLASGILRSHFPSL